MHDKLVKRLRESKNEQCYIGCFGNCGDCKIDSELEQAADAIEELSKPRWIPVTERLPETGEIVLVYGKRGGIYTAEHNRSARWPGSFWKLNSKSHHCEPTHWMPLPEPPKEE